MELGESAPPRWTIAGVIEDVQQQARGEPPRPEIYLSYRQLSSGVRFDEPMLAVRSERDPDLLVARVRQAVDRLHAGIHLDSVMTMEGRLMTSLARPRLYAILLGGFAGLALLIAGVGLFGVLGVRRGAAPA